MKVYLLADVRLANLLGLWFILSGLVVGCAYVPSAQVKFILKAEDQLYVAADDGSFKILNSETYKLTRKITIPEMETPYLKKVLQDGQDLVLQVSKGSTVVPSLDNRIYILKRNAGMHNFGIDLKNAASLTALDQEYFYFVQQNWASDGTFQGFRYIGYRYDKKNKRRLEFHFEENPELVVIDAWKDNSYIWYLCLHDFETSTVPHGRMALLLRSLTGNKYKRFDSGENKYYNVHITGDDQNVWIFGHRQKPGTLENCLIRFNKGEQMIKTYQIPWNLVPTNQDQLSERSRSIWTFDPGIGNWGKFCRINKENLRPMQSPLVRCIKISRDPGKEFWTFGDSTYADEEYIWIGLTLKSSAWGRAYIPYIMRISKENFSSELFLVKPTFEESSQTVVKSFFADLAAPFYLLVLLLSGR
jgi:hypothetical protein